MTEVPARDVLDRLFRAIVREAENNDAFARSLIDALQANLAARAGKKAPARKPFDASQLHAINVLRTHGENVLRGKLEQVKAVEDLRAVARFSGLLLTGPAARPKANARRHDRGHHRGGQALRRPAQHGLGLGLSVAAISSPASGKSTRCRVTAVRPHHACKPETRQGRSAGPSPPVVNRQAYATQRHTLSH